MHTTIEAVDSTSYAAALLYFTGSQQYVLYAESEGQRVVIANTHILFNPKRGDIKVPTCPHACNDVSFVWTNSSLSVDAAVRLRKYG